MISLHAVYQFYHIHTSIGMLLQKITTNTCAAGCRLHLFLLGKSQLSWMSKNGQDSLVGWAVLLLPPPGYMADHSSILSL